MRAVGVTRARAALRVLKLLVLLPTVGWAQGGLPGIAERTRTMQKLDGFMPLYWDASAGRLFLEVARFETDFLYIVSLPAGLGSNDVGLDRSQLGGTRVVRFQRVGPRVLLVEPNLRYRASSPNPAERRAVEESFATSVLWGFRAEAESDGRVLVDVTEFALRDAHGVIGALARTGQGTYRLDPNRSVVYLPRTKAFPRNTEIEVLLTFQGENPGAWVRQVTPTAEAVTVRQRHSLVELPPPGFQPRRFDPRAGYGARVWYDYTATFPEPLERRFAPRHRLAKRNPAAAVSEPVQPIVYYVDPGVPEPIRSAVLEGARWWNQAFEAAGYRDAFRVELLPDTADPMDVRYNVIQWVHRATRGWSYGSTVTDPRTGEILKGHVLLGSLRIRQDFLIAEGLLSPYATGRERATAAEAMGLARIRQLAAHEVGHTLGLSHNYVGSAQGRASVMDYPHPLVRLAADGSIDLSDAYATGIGEWDKVAITWGYQHFVEGTDEAAALDRILAEARRRGLTFFTDQDARPVGSAHPQAHLWDNGSDAAFELDRVLRVRRAALDRFGESALRLGSPLAALEDVFVPLYLHHRYQVEAAVKLVAGQDYTFALRGDGQTPVRSVEPAVQRRALESVLATLRPEVLAMPRTLLASVPPRPPGFPSHRELFERHTGPVFDAIAPATAAAAFSVRLVLDPARAARLVQQHALDPAQPGLVQVVDRLLEVAFATEPSDPYHAELIRAVQRVVVEGLMTLALDAPSGQVRAVVELKLEELRDRLAAGAVGGGERGSVEDRAHRRLLAADVRRFLDREYTPQRRLPLPDLPPGAPIGDWDHDWPWW
jgi:hypothetical protein